METTKLKLKGLIFDHLTVIEEHPTRNKNHVMWLCKRSCGNLILKEGYRLKREKYHNCGCQEHPNKKHGLSNSLIYKVWQGMIQRCSNPNHESYKYYGARGIIVSENWLDFENFYFDMAKSYLEGLTIDRINNDDGYHKDNCRWVSMSVQNSNKSSNLTIKTPWGNASIKEASLKSGIPYKAIVSRIKAGWPNEKLFNKKAP